MVIWKIFFLVTYFPQKILQVLLMVHVVSSHSLPQILRVCSLNVVLKTQE